MVVACFAGGHIAVAVGGVGRPRTDHGCYGRVVWSGCVAAGVVAWIHPGCWSGALCGCVASWWLSCDLCCFVLLLRVLAVYENHIIVMRFCWQGLVVALHNFGGELLHVAC